MDTPVDRKHIGEYQLLEILHESDVSTVYRARDPRLSREVAIKIPSPRTLNDPELLDRFLTEARLCASLKHPNIVMVYEVGHEDDVPFIVMQYLSGLSLARMIAESGAIEPKAVLQILEQLAKALSYLHQRGAVHGDIKPDNVFVQSPDGRVCLIDFGLAGHPDTIKSTSMLSVLGTPAFMSPEQVEHRPLTPASDVYSMAVTAFQMLCGELPFEYESVAMQMRAHVFDKIPSLTKRRRGLPAEVDAVFARALAKQPAQRWDSATEFVQALREALQSTREVGPMIWWQSRPLQAALASAAVILVGIALASLVGPSNASSGGGQDDGNISMEGDRILTESVTVSPTAKDTVTTPSASEAPIDREASHTPSPPVTVETTSTPTPTAALSATAPPPPSTATQSMTATPVPAPPTNTAAPAATEEPDEPEPDPPTAPPSNTEPPFPATPDEPVRTEPPNPPYP